MIKKKKRDRDDPNPEVVRTISVPDMKGSDFVDHPMQLVLLDQADLQLNYLVRQEAARMLTKIIDAYADQQMIDAIRGAIETGQQKDQAEWVVAVVDKIIERFAEDGADLNIGEAQMAKWRNWTGVWGKVREQKASVEKNMPRPRQKTARTWEGKSDLQQLLERVAA